MITKSQYSNFPGDISQSFPFLFNSSKIIMDPLFHIFHFEFDVEPTQEGWREDEEDSGVSDEAGEGHWFVGGALWGYIGFFGK